MKYKKVVSTLIIIGFSTFSFAQKADILKVTTHKLVNGFTILLNEDSTATNVFGAVMVKAGAANELPSATGMAHYLEHLLFKGTETLGTSDYIKEKPYLDSIAVLYEKLALETDEQSQINIQQLINNQAVKASNYGLPNEFDKLLKSIGSTRINAFTNYDMTFYYNLFPAHEIEKWLDIYATRFDKPVFRSFQSELEVVYEEKNRAMDGMERRIFKELNSAMFPNLPYGQWDVLGKIEHLKKPSLKNMQAFYTKQYVAKNMALILSGNFKAEEVLPIIKEKFGGLSSKEAPQLNLPPLQPLPKNKVEKIRITPIKIELLGWQTVPYSHADRVALDVCESILINYSETGILDKLTTNNDLMYIFGGGIQYNNAAGFYLIAVPKPIIQSIANTDKKIEGAFNRVKAGNFSEEQLNAAKFELINEFQKNIEQIGSRGVAIGQAFSKGLSWEEYMNYTNKVNLITKEEVVRVANTYFGAQKAKIISRTGFPKKVKLDKPPFKAVTNAQSDSSVYASSFNKIEPKPFEPKFLDFNTDIASIPIYANHNLTRVNNPVNNLFYLKLKFKTGKINTPKLGVVANLLNYSGAGTYSFAEFKQAFSSIGCMYYVSCTDNYFTISIDGIEANLPKALKLLDALLHTPHPDDDSFKLMVKSAKLDVKREKRDKYALGNSVYQYAKYEQNSPLLTKPSIKELSKMDITHLMESYKKMVNSYKTTISYVGNTPIYELKKELETNIDLFDNKEDGGFKSRQKVNVSKNIIYFVNDKKAIQSQVYYYVPDDKTQLENYDKVQAFNQYFGGGFSGLILQEIREYRSLAYTARASYVMPINSTGHFTAYLGCQAGKTVEAIHVLDSLITNMPVKEDRIKTLKKSLQLSTISNYPDFKTIINKINTYQLQGYTADPAIRAYTQYQDLTMSNIVDFYEKSIKSKPYIITIYGDKRKIDLDKLKNYGEIIELKLKDVIKL